MPIWSPQHGYLFILMPRTASSAIGQSVLIDELDVQIPRART